MDDRFSSMFGADRGLPEGAALDDEDVVRALIAGQLGEGTRYRVLTYPNGPDPSAFFLIEKALLSDDALRGDGIVAARWEDADGTLNVSVSPEFMGEPCVKVIDRRCSLPGARSLLTTTAQLGLDAAFASGTRPDLEKEDRSVTSPPYPREGEEWFKVPRPATT